MQRAPLLQLDQVEAPARTQTRTVWVERDGNRLSLGRQADADAGTLRTRQSGSRRQKTNRDIPYQRSSKATSRSPISTSPPNSHSVLPATAMDVLIRPKGAGPDFGGAKPATLRGKKPLLQIPRQTAVALCRQCRSEHRGGRNGGSGLLTHAPKAGAYSISLTTPPIL